MVFIKLFPNYIKAIFVRFMIEHLFLPYISFKFVITIYKYILQAPHTIVADAHRQSIDIMAFHPAGHCLATASHDGGILLCTSILFLQNL